MHIFDLINLNCTDENFTGDIIYVPEGCWTNLNKFFTKELTVEDIKKKEGEKIDFAFTFRGEINIKIGIFRHGYSFTWLYEHKFISSEWRQETLPLDLSVFLQGVLEIKVLALQESSFLIKDSSVLSKAIEMPINKNFVLYNFISPTLDLCSEEQIYYKFLGSNIYYSFEDSCVHMGKETCADLLTYFNAFSACKWTKYTNIKNLSAYIDFIGKADVILIHKDAFGEHNLCCYSIASTKRTTFELPIGSYPSTGILGLQIFAHTSSTLFGGGWLSPDPQTQSIRLGIGITTFKRETAVKAAVQRLSHDISSNPLYSESIDITVVDNGQTLSPEDVQGATLIPNKNLGGTGGFMRSLIHYQDTGKYTHCLFMDDDASCEAGSIFRSVSFMNHAKDTSIAISGAMLSENIKFMQWENGAWFDKGCHPLHCNYDLRIPEVLFANENEDAPAPTYGAWWFFMFPLSHVSMYSFPFFVRGDDIQFSYTNRFKIVRMNGIAVWQEDFKIKESPMTLYLDIRSHILHHLVLEHIAYGPKKILKMVWSFFYRFNWAYQYDTANAILCSFSHILRGPQYWIDNIDTKEIRNTIKNKYNIEKPSLLHNDYKTMQHADNNIRLPFLTKFIRRISLNGHLLPAFMESKKLEYLYKYEIPFLNRTFLRKNILIIDTKNKLQFTLSKNSLYFVKNIFLFFKTSCIFIIKYKKIKHEYLDFYKNMSSNNFWKKIFNI